MKTVQLSAKQIILNKLNEGKLKNSLASRKTNYKKAAIKADVTYAEYVKDKCGVTIAVFEDHNWSLPARKTGGSAPIKGTPEWNEYKSVASRKTYMKTVLMCVECVDPATTNLDAFVKKYTSAATTEEFLSTAYCKDNKSSYSVKGYEFLKEFH